MNEILSDVDAKLKKIKCTDSVKLIDMWVENKGEKQAEFRFLVIT